MKKSILLAGLVFLVGCSAVIAGNYLNKGIEELNIDEAYAVLRGNLTSHEEYYKAFEIIGFVKGARATYYMKYGENKKIANCINKSPLIWEDIVFDKYKKGDLSSDTTFVVELLKEMDKCVSKK